MTLSVANTAEEASPLRGLLPLWVGVFVYALLFVAGDRLLLDPDTQWQITVGQWILDHRAVPETDAYSFTMRGQPWISTQWLAQVVYAKIYGWFGWTGPVVLAAGASAATFALLTRFLSRRLSDSATLVFVSVAVALTASHILARPHVLALPVMVAWVGGLIAAADRRGAPSFWLLPLMVLWANLHGGFVFGLMMIAPIALDAVLGAQVNLRKSLALRWAAFAAAALIAGCCTPYGWNSLLASQKILALGGALPLIMEWKPADFGSLGALELCLLLGMGLALWRGVKLPPLRIVLLLGLLHMALAQARASEILALLAPLVVAAPLARPCDGVEAPGLFAGVSVESDNVVPPSRSAADSLHHLALGYQRPAGDPYSQLVIADLVVPDDLPSLPFEAEPMPEGSDFIRVLVGNRRRRPNAQFSPADGIDRRHFIGMAPLLLARVGVEALDGFM